jgi:hypothetical protein
MSGVLWVLCMVGVLALSFAVARGQRFLQNQRVRACYSSLCRQFGLIGHFNRPQGGRLLPVALGTYRGRLTRIDSAQSPSRRLGSFQTKIGVSHQAAKSLSFSLHPRAPSERSTAEDALVWNDALLERHWVWHSDSGLSPAAIITDKAKERLRTCIKLRLDRRGVHAEQGELSYTASGLCDGATRQRLFAEVIELLHDLADSLENPRDQAK